MKMDKYSSKNEYIARINRVINHIQMNLDTNLTLEKLAKVACFSQFHFHRIFKSITGESLYSFIKRLRLEKSAYLLKKGSDLQITEIAYLSGFSSSSNYAYAFKEHFGMTPKKFRVKEVSLPNSFLDNKPLTVYIENNPSEFQHVTESMHLDIKDLPGYHVAYVRHIGKYEKCGKAWRTVIKWVRARRLINDSTYYIGISYDSPVITPVDKCRYDACITVPGETEASGKVSIADIRPATYAVYRFDDKIDYIGQTYHKIYCQWLPQSGYQPGECPCIEFHYNNPEDNPERRVTSDLCVPVKSL